MIDFHTHLDLYPNALSLLEKVNKINQFTLSVTTSPRAWLATSQVFKKYSNIKVAIGIHPEVVEEKYGELELLLSCISKARFIGEVGLDASKAHCKTMDKQEFVYDCILKEGS